MLVLQYFPMWEEQLLGFLKHDMEAVDIVPGSDTKAIKFMFVEMDYNEATGLVENFGRYPRFALLPLPWYTTVALKTAAHCVEVSMSFAL